MNKMVKALDAPEEVIIPEESKTTREIEIPESRTRAAAAEVRFVEGKGWRAVRLDGQPRWCDKFGPRTTV